MDWLRDFGRKPSVVDERGPEAGGAPLNILKRLRILDMAKPHSFAVWVILARPPYTFR
jgi:hypothetical protein